MEEDLSLHLAPFLSAILLYGPMGHSGPCSEDTEQAVCRKASMDVWDPLCTCCRPYCIWKRITSSSGSLHYL